MAHRREFKKAIRREIIARASDMILGLACEKCSAKIKETAFEVHHIDQDAMLIDKSAALTAKDGLLLCLPCHDEITRQQAPVLARAVRLEDKRTGAWRAPRAKIANRGFPETDPRPSIGAVRIDKSALPTLPRRGI